MTHPQVFGQKFTPIRRFLAWKTHPFWPHIPNMTQYGSAPRLKLQVLQRIFKSSFEAFILELGLFFKFGVITWFTKQITKFVRRKFQERSKTFYEVPDWSFEVLTINGGNSPSCCRSRLKHRDFPKFYPGSKKTPFTVKLYFFFTLFYDILNGG